LPWIDYARAIGIFFVVLGHCATGGSTAWRLIFAWHMPFFFIISGLTFNPSRYPHFGAFLRRRAQTLLLPYLCLNLLVLPFELFRVSLNPLNNLVGFLYGEGAVTLYGLPINLLAKASWFLLALFLTEVVYYLLYRLWRGHLLGLTLTCAVFSILTFIAYAHTDIPYVWHVDTVPLAVLYFHLGFLFMRYVWPYLAGRIVKRRSWAPELVCALVLLAAGIVAAYYSGLICDLNKSRLNYPGWLFFCSLTVAAGWLLLCVVLGRGLGERAAGRLIQTVGRSTLVILGIHFELIFWAKRWAGGWSALGALPSGVWPFVPVFLASVLLAWMIGRWLPAASGQVGRQKALPVVLVGWLALTVGGLIRLILAA
jgi:fucose 4-O-acetylase-like acetyltransferase